MAVDKATWDRFPGAFEDKGIASYLKAMERLFTAYEGDPSSSNEKLLRNNMKGLRDAMGKAKTAKRGDKPALGAIDKLEKEIKGMEGRMDKVVLAVRKALTEHLQLRVDLTQKLKGTYARNLKGIAGRVVQGVADVKAAMKAKSRDDTLAQAEVLRGEIRLIDAMEADMRADMVPVREPTGARRASLQMLPDDIKRDKLIPATNACFKANTALLKEMRAVKAAAAKWQDNAQKVAPALT